MLLSSFIVLSSLVATTLAAPIPMKQRRSFQPWDNLDPLPARATSADPPKDSDGGWPKSTNAKEEQSAFGIKQDISSYLKEHNGEPVMDAHYPKGSYAGSKPPGPGIAGFIVDGDGNVGITDAKKASFSYMVQFPDDPDAFEFALAGKLPGMYGGDNAQIAGTCAGGNHDDKCWSARLMWREEGKGELYAYLPTANKNNTQACSGGKCSIKYGASIGTGSWSFTPGKWTKLEEIVTLNDFKNDNGEIEVLVDGESKIHVKNLVLRTSEEGRIQGAMIHTFFGGSSKPDYASPKDQHAYFKDFKFSVLEKL